MGIGTAGDVPLQHAYLRSVLLQFLRAGAAGKGQDGSVDTKLRLQLVSVLATLLEFTPEEAAEARQAVAAAPTDTWFGVAATLTSKIFFGGGGGRSNRNPELVREVVVTEPRDPQRL